MRFAGGLAEEIRMTPKYIQHVHPALSLATMVASDKAGWTCWMYLGVMRISSAKPPAKRMPTIVSLVRSAHCRLVGVTMTSHIVRKTSPHNDVRSHVRANPLDPQVSFVSPVPDGPNKQ